MKRLLLATVTMAVISGTAYAMPGHGMPGMCGPGGHCAEGLLRALIELDLTEAQKHEAALILAKYRERGKETRDALRTATGELREATEAAAFDENAVRAAFKGVAAAGEEMAVHGAKLVAELKGILTPEQKAARQEKHRDLRENGSSFLDEWIDIHSKEPQ